MRWAGGADFAGVLTFDECHKAKNFDTKNEEKSTKMAQAVIELQRQMPMARRRVIDCSAPFGPLRTRPCEEAIYNFLLPLLDDTHVCVWCHRPPPPHPLRRA